MKKIYIGSFYPKDRENEFKKNSLAGIDNAANNFQSALMDGLDYYYPEIKVVTLPAIASYPLKYKKMRLESSIFSYRPNSVDYCVGFLNIPLIKHFSKYKNAFKRLEILTKADEDVIIFIYSVHSPYLKAVYELKKIRPKLKTCLIVPDLPKFMSESKNIFYRFLKNLDSLLIRKYLPRIDSFVLLSEHMTNYIDVNDRPWVRIEGIFNSEGKMNVFQKEINKTILYTGNVDERYGIKTLLEAFSLIKDENFRLWIRGNGNTLKDIQEAASFDSRITYFEEMSRYEIIELQKKATVLINPVPTKEEFTKYFFPSKVMDYLASGTPTISTKILGIPNDYYKYMYIPNKDDAEGLRDIIIEVCNKEQSQLDEFGEKASQFILKCKNSKVQVKKITDMIDNL